MSNETSNPGLARSARRLQIGVLAMLALIISIYVAGQLGLGVAGTPIVFRARSLGATAATLVGDGVILLLAIAVFWLIAALRSIERGGLFARRTIRQFRQFALWLLLMALVSSLAPLLVSLVVADQSRPHHIVITLDIRDLLLIGITGLLFLLARLLERAGEIEQENREIV